MRKRSRIGTKQWSGPSGCFLWPMRPQVPVRRSKMSQSVDVFSVLLKRGMPGATRQPGQPAANCKAGKPAAKGKAAKGAKKAKGKSDDKEPEPASAPATEDWWRGTQEEAQQEALADQLAVGLSPQHAIGVGVLLVWVLLAGRPTGGCRRGYS